MLITSNAFSLKKKHIQRYEPIARLGQYKSTLVQFLMGSVLRKFYLNFALWVLQVLYCVF